MSSTFVANTTRKRVSFGATGNSTTPQTSPSSSFLSEESENRLIVFGLGEAMTAPGLCDALLLTPACPAGDVEVVRFFVGRDGSRNAILVASPNICAFFAARGYITVERLQVRIRPFVFIGRCNNCFGIGHLAGSCSSDPTCGRCGGRHSAFSCSLKPACLNCRGDPTHRTDSSSCPTFLAYKAARLDASRISLSPPRQSVMSTSSPHKSARTPFGSPATLPSNASRSPASVLPPLPRSPIPCSSVPLPPAPAPYRPPFDVLRDNGSHHNQSTHSLEQSVNTSHDTSGSSYTFYEDDPYHVANSYTHPSEAW